MWPGGRRLGRGLDGNECDAEWHLSKSGKQHNGVQPSNEARWLRRLVGYCWRFKRDVIIALAGALLYTAATLSIPLLQRDIIDNVIVSHKESVWPLAIGLLIAAVANFFGIYMRRYRGGKMALDVQHAMRTELFESLSKLDGARQDEIHTGQLVGRSISDINMAQQLLQWVPLILGSVLLFVFSLVIMIILSPLLALVAVAVAPALWLIATASRRKLFPASWHAQQLVGEVAGIVDETVGGVRVVKGFGQEAAGNGADGVHERGALRLPAADDPAHRQVQPRAHRHPLARPRRRAPARRLARHPRRRHPRHVPRVLQLPRPARRPGAGAHQPGHHRPGGPRQRHPGLRGHRLQAGHHRQAGRHRPAGRRERDHVRGREVRLRAVPARAARAVPGSQAGRDRRRHRAIGLGQVHALPAPPPVLRRARRRGEDRRARRPRRHRAVAARRRSAWSWRSPSCSPTR